MLEHLDRGDDPGPGGGELDRQWQAVEPAAELHDRSEVVASVPEDRREASVFALRGFGPRDFAASHPGGGVMGACGKNAATEILRDRPW